MKNTNVKIKDFLILTENFELDKNVVKEVSLEKEMIGFVFYASGSMSVNVSLEKNKNEYVKRGGMASSFYYSPNVTSIKHEIASNTPLSKLSLFIEPKKLKQLIGEEQELDQLLKPDAPFVEGTSSYLTIEMYSAIHKIMNCEFNGPSKSLMLESQAVELLAHYIDKVAKPGVAVQKIMAADIDKLLFAKELIDSQMESPPTLNELSRLCGLNIFKLKSGFKEVYGLPVYQYIKNEKMKIAFNAIQETGNTVQEAAFAAGYNSLGSFSNAFYKKFGIRPSEVNK